MRITSSDSGEVTSSQLRPVQRTEQLHLMFVETKKEKPNTQEAWIEQAREVAVRQTKTTSLAGTLSSVA